MKKLLFAITLLLVAYTSTAQNVIRRQPTKPAQQTQQTPQKPAKTPAKKKPTTSQPANVVLCPDDNHPHMIDLGLPSSTKWACCNVGASKPEDFGNYFAWGETKPKTNYDWSTYLYCKGTEQTCQDLGLSISGTQYDVAKVEWGGSWQLPTKEQALELITNCDYKLTTVKGVKGGMFTSKKNGHVLFLPDAGRYWGSTLNHGDGSSFGDYWLGTAHPTVRDVVSHILLFKDRAAYDNGFVQGSRRQGKTVRPVAQ